MMDRREEDEVPGANTRQAPHVPGQGSGMPRQRDAEAVPPREPADAESAESPQGHGAPLGGSKVTEEQLSADTDVERDALKALDPDDTPA